MIKVSKPEYVEVIYNGYKYLRNIICEEWFYLSDFSWLYMNWIDYQELEEAYQQYLKSCDLALPTIEIQ